jgi:hypothetical protein
MNIIVGHSDALPLLRRHGLDFSRELRKGGCIDSAALAACA